jgi:SP family facilitated glucose transporter-like MFS transporter 8
MIVGAVLVGATILSCIFADLAGRRILLLISGLLMATSIIVLGVYFYLSTVVHVSNIGWLSLLSLLIFVAFFSIGWGPLPWLVMSEMLPARAKGLAGGLATSVNWLFAFIATKEFEDLQMALNNYGAFWAFGCICFLGVIFVFFFLPETKGKSLEEIESHYQA